MNPIRVLFLCSENSCRSQMAEGFLKRYGGDAFEVHSAGVSPAPIHHLTIDAMARSGIDISAHRSKSVEEFLGREFDFVISVCDRAREDCPTNFGGARLIHWRFNDPAAESGPLPAQRRAFQRTRDEIAGRVRLFAYAQTRRRPSRPVAIPALQIG